jgi:hypothetical protein
MMFDMTAPNSRQHASQKTKSGVPVTPSPNTQFLSESGQHKDAWFREEEMMRKKLEKGAINQLKNRIAQQNRAAGSKQAQQEAAHRDDNDSDMDPNEKPEEVQMGTGAGGATNPTQI